MFYNLMHSDLTNVAADTPSATASSSYFPGQLSEDFLDMLFSLINFFYLKL